MIQIIRTDKRGNSYAHTFIQPIDAIMSLANYVKFIGASKKIEVIEAPEET